MSQERLEKLKAIMMNATPHEDIRREVRDLFLYLEHLEILAECNTVDFRELNSSHRYEFKEDEYMGVM